MTRSELVDEVTDLQAQLHLAHQHVSARDGIIEGAHATMVVQNLFVQKQSISLNTKENERSRSNTKVSMNGKGRHLTGTEFWSEVEGAEKAKADKAAEKERKKNSCESAKNARQELEERWKVMKAAHGDAVQAWKERCEELRSQGMKRKDLPERPPRVYKPKLKEPGAGDDDSNDDEDSNDKSGEY
ncbi:hypothetical protein ARMSODRAFT_1026031 [Armillaria solidipes]|uniref:Uncharacterized protein n=1 Tax=Armillaria solidipes TaxID=1076256 RepID=A0A2H3B1K8_9AGAR|nr:hypothetical protein ARMSODRAFT_1026031 [Armillaria solidipes]